MTESRPQGAFRLHAGVELARSEDGGFAWQSDPLQAIRINAAAFQLLRWCRNGFPDEGSATRVSEQSAFFDSLCRARILEWIPTEPDFTPPVSVVVPVFNRARELETCLESIHSLAYPEDQLEIIVVDDGSRDGSPEVARSFGAEVICAAQNRGPAAARNLGVAHAAGEIIAFTDSDCAVDSQWLRELIPYFGNQRFALVGGRVDAYFRSRRFDRYEEACSPLNMGSKRVEGVGADSMFYLPTCNMLVARSAFIGVGGFDERLRFGEDVDLCWKLLQVGHRLLYLPKGAVAHRHRAHLRGSLRQRFDYGTSEAMLYDRHRQVRKRFPLRPAQVLFASILALGLCGYAVIAAPLLVALLLGDFLVKSRRMRWKFKLPIGTQTILVATIRNYFALTYHLATHLLRYYLFPLLAVALLFPRTIPLLLVTAALPAATVFRMRKPALDFPSFWLFFLLDQALYQAGVIRGCIGTGSLRLYQLSFRKQTRCV